MPTASEAAAAERDRWMEVAAAATALRRLADLVPTEASVVRFFDPAADLERRAGQWGYRFGERDLADLARFAAALAATEAGAWEEDDPVLATRSLEARRFLIGDRIVHWAVPWLDQTGRCYPSRREEAHAAAAAVLEISGLHRLAPEPGGEGTTPPGEDAFGPLDISADPSEFLLSLWSGVVLLDATATSMLGRPAQRAELASDSGARRDLADLYRLVAGRWLGFALRNPGTARLWKDLSVRAHRTAERLAG